MSTLWTFGSPCPLVPFLLSIISGLVFFYMAFEYQVLRLVTGWFLLFGGAVIGLVGLWALASVIT